LRWSYLLSTIRQAYREFEERVQALSRAPGAKSELVRVVIDSMPREFTAAEVAAACPDVSPALVRKVLRELRDAGRLTSGTGRGAKWQKVSPRW